MKNIIRKIAKIPVNIMIIFIDITLIICMLIGIEDKAVAKRICVSISAIAVALSMALIKILGE